MAAPSADEPPAASQQTFSIPASPFFSALPVTPGIPALRPVFPMQFPPAQAQPYYDEEEEDEEEEEPAVKFAYAPAWKTLLSGGIAGAISRTATAPLERLKILFQLATMSEANAKYNGIADAVRQITQKEGVKALWKGNGTNVLRIAPYSAIGFFGFDRFFRMMAEGAEPDQMAIRRVIAGGMAGACASSATYPLDLVRTRLTLQSADNQKYRGIYHALSSVARAEGLLSLYKGLGTTLVGIIPYNAINFATFDTVQSFVRGGSPKLSAIQALWVGAISGAVAATATYPLDLLRRRMQMRSELGGPKIYSGLRDASVKIFRAEGIRGFFRGLIPCYLKVIPSNAIGFAVYDICKKVFKFESGSPPSGG